MNPTRCTPLATVLLAAVLLLAGCAAQNATSAGAPKLGISGPGEPLTATELQAVLGKITNDDLKAAIKIAQAQTPPDTEAISCFNYLDIQLTSLQSRANDFVPPAGVVSAFEASRIGVGVVANGLSAAQKAALEQACGPYLMSVIGDLNALLAMFGRAAVIKIP